MDIAKELFDYSRSIEDRNKRMESYFNSFQQVGPFLDSLFKKYDLYEKEESFDIEYITGEYAVTFGNTSSYEYTTNTKNINQTIIINYSNVKGLEINESVIDYIRKSDDDNQPSYENWNLLNVS